MDLDVGTRLTLEERACLGRHRLVSFERLSGLGLEGHHDRYRGSASTRIHQLLAN